MINKAIIRKDIRELKNLIKYYIANKQYAKANECESEIKELEQKLK